MEKRSIVRAERLRAAPARGPESPGRPGSRGAVGQAYSKLRHQIVTHYNAVTQVRVCWDLFGPAIDCFLPLLCESHVCRNYCKDVCLPCLACRASSRWQHHTHCKGCHSMADMLQCVAPLMSGVLS